MRRDQLVMNATTQELLEELDRRMEGWPQNLGHARALFRGATKALFEVSEKQTWVRDILQRRSA